MLLQLKAQILDLNNETLIEKAEGMSRLFNEKNLSVNSIIKLTYKNKKSRPKSDNLLLGLFVHALLEKSLAKKSSISLVKLGQEIFLRHRHHSGTEYFDVNESGSLVSEEYIFDLLHFDPQVQVLTFQDIVENYLEIMASELESKKSSSKSLLIIYEFLLAIKGFDSRLLLKRVEILNQLGLWSKALSDLKRLALFNGVDFLPQPFKKLYFTSEERSESLH